VRHASSLGSDKIPGIKVTHHSNSTLPTSILPYLVGRDWFRHRSRFIQAQLIENHEKSGRRWRGLYLRLPSIQKKQRNVGKAKDVGFC